MKKLLYLILPNILLALVGCGMALISLEIGTRLLPMPYPTTDGGLICSDQFGWRGKPNYEATLTIDGYTHQFKHNGAGMHDQDHALAKPKNNFRILMLGDSFVRAAHVAEAETAHQILENILNERHQPTHFEVISGAVSGWGTGQELLYYRNEGRQYQPDLVLLMFYIGNDFNDNLPGKALTLEGKNCYAPYFAICAGQLETSPWDYAPGLPAVLNSCPYGSHTLYNALGQLYPSARLYTQLEPLMAQYARPVNLDYYYFYFPPKEPKIEEAWQLTFALIKQLHHEVSQDGAKFAVGLISPADVIAFTQMNDRQRESLYQKIPDLRQINQVDFPNQRLTQTLTAENIKVLDLLPSFSPSITATAEPLYFPSDRHWNVAGHRRAAEVIADWLPSHYELKPGKR